MKNEKINPESATSIEVKPIRRLTTYNQCKTKDDALDFIKSIDNAVAGQFKMTETKEWFVEVLSVLD